MELYYEAIDTLKGMISRPSFSRDEAAVADFLQQTWQAAGHTVHRKGNNLWIVSPGFDLNKQDVYKRQVLLPGLIAKPLAQ